MVIVFMGGLCLKGFGSSAECPLQFGLDVYGVSSTISPICKNRQKSNPSHVCIYISFWIFPRQYFLTIVLIFLHLICYQIDFKEKKNMRVIDHHPRWPLEHLVIFNALKNWIGLGALHRARPLISFSTHHEMKWNQME